MELEEKNNNVERNKDKGNAIERYSKSFLHAIDGLVYCAKYEHNIIIIIVVALLVTICGFLFKISACEWLFIITMIGVISACEMINSSIEATIDLITTDIHPLAKIAKDTASSASLVLCVASLIGGIIIFLPRIISLIGG